MSTKSNRYLLAVAVSATILIGFSGTTWAHGGPPPDAASLIEQLDQNGDGKLSADEFKGPAEHFTRMDTDGDGYLTKEELEAGRPAPMGGKGGFEQDDADGDGRVSKEEFSGPEDLFDRLDADGDGYITREEARPAGGMGHGNHAR